MVLYVLDAAQQEDVRATVVVVGREATWVEKEISERRAPNARLTFVEQREQLGTGHAVGVALSSLDDAFGDLDGDVLILPGDAPLLRRSSVEQLLAAHRERHAALTMLGARVEDPTGYGRMIHAKDGSLQRVVEESDATSDERRITEVNTSVMVVRQSLLGPALRHLDRHNAQEEYYLPDLVSVLHDLGHVTTSVMLEDATEGSNINDRRQLARAEAVMRQRINDQWLTPTSNSPPRSRSCRARCYADAASSLGAPRSDPTRCCATSRWARTRWSVPSRPRRFASGPTRASVPSSCSPPVPTWRPVKSSHLRHRDFADTRFADTLAPWSPSPSAAWLSSRVAATPRSPRTSRTSLEWSSRRRIFANSLTVRFTVASTNPFAGRTFLSCRPTVHQ
jgi:dTDP-glucose pyrophosphorylase